ncbi:shikimate kinase [Elizabethkingia sp. JS20170427COW]|uniref:shikimate kinase n=1 Tax=Elizabethkingia sp. JS20170427COW TaxID=2583851 RepID=UPI0011107159|nr:shikimate kinase [Elizabethkingia sp. JS20170427COW]QCX52851.1 shikimate kinase [Elizabethkingia sp. JS20170427COW]
MIISLIGYMGSGKSHISKMLSDKINFKLFDLDFEISARLGMSIPEIFEKQGELGFRKAEKKILEELLSSPDDIIISLGGGTPAYYDNMENICKHSKSIYLRAKIPTLVNRLIPEKDKRPLIAKISDEDLPEFIAKHLFERNAFYNQSEFIIDTDGKNGETVVEEIVNTLCLPR